MTRVPHKKNKNNYTVSVPHHSKKMTQRATSAKMHSQLGQRWFLENLHFSRLESKDILTQIILINYPIK